MSGALTALLPAAQVTDGIGADLLVPLGAVAAILTLVGMLLLLPLFVAQRREIDRLLGWREREPGAGEPPQSQPAPSTAAAPRHGPMTAAERVTAERPALIRISTSEYAAVQPTSRWRRVVERGPRHPLVIALIALTAAAVIFVAAGLLLRAGDDGRPGKGIDPASIEVVVLNASTTSGLADEVADGAAAAGFSIAGTGTGMAASRSVVRYADGSERAARSVARRLDIRGIAPFDREAEAEAAGADVVVVAGDDRARQLDDQEP